jgi:parvulin-like peptidyl-prolyl isomerase
MRPVTESCLRSSTAVAVLALLSALSVLTPTGAGAEEINRVVLRVNDQILTLHDYEQRKSLEIERILESAALSPAERQEHLANVGKVVMFSVFRELLMESHAKRTGTAVTDREVEEQIRSMQKEQGIETREELDMALANSGMTMDQLRDTVRQELKMSAVVRRDVTAKIEVPEDELRAIYRNNPDRFKVPEERHLEEVIVLEESGLGAEALAERAAALVAQVRAGTDLAEAAQDYQDQGIATGVIDLGWLQRDEIGKALADAAWELDQGGVSDAIDGRGGLHIMRLVEARGGELLAYSQVEDQILGRERQRRFGKALNDFMAELAASSYVVEDVPPDAIGYRALADFTLEDELAEFRGPLKKPAAQDADADQDDGTDGASDEAGEDGTGDEAADDGTGGDDTGGDDTGGGDLG